jgi:hypothetical protein
MLRVVRGAYIINLCNYETWCEKQILNPKNEINNNKIIFQYDISTQKCYIQYAIGNVG